MLIFTNFQMWPLVHIRASVSVALNVVERACAAAFRSVTSKQCHFTPLYYVNSFDNWTIIAKTLFNCVNVNGDVSGTSFNTLFVLSFIRLVIGNDCERLNVVHCLRCRFAFWCYCALLYATIFVVVEMMLPDPDIGLNTATVFVVPVMSCTITHHSCNSCFIYVFALFSTLCLILLYFCIKHLVCGSCRVLIYFLAN